MQQVFVIHAAKIRICFDTANSLAVFFVSGPLQADTAFFATYLRHAAVTP